MERQKKLFGEEKQKHIYKAAEYYLYKNKLDDIFTRIDVIEVYVYNRQNNIKSHKTGSRINEKDTMENYIKIGSLDINKLGKYIKRVTTDEVILTYERLNNHILIYHKKEYIQIEQYIRSIIEDPDFILEDNSNNDTLIFLKHINEIDKKARIVIKLVTDKGEEIYTKNSIITIMRQRDKSWNQTIKNKGKIIFQKTRQN